MNGEVKQLKHEAEMARLEYRTGHISREEAKIRIMPYIETLNNRSRELAKKYNQKPKLVSFISYIRQARSCDLAFLLLSL